MPEMTFSVRWPDGGLMRCYSPSLVVQEHLTVGSTYPVGDLVAATRTALGIASDRVQARFGFPCSRARAQITAIEQTARRFGADELTTVEEFAVEEST